MLPKALAGTNISTYHRQRRKDTSSGTAFVSGADAEVDGNPEEGKH